MRALPVAALALALAGPAAAGTSCPATFAGGLAPALAKASLARDTREICLQSFTVLHSGVTRTPLWSAEHLTRASVSAARGMDRTNAFHPEASLQPPGRAELSDYARSGYDRGHMAPSGDMPDAVSQEQSFTLANMVPQDPDNNRNLWASIETAVRDLAAREGEAYVVTGPAFRGETLKSLKGRVLVPTDVWKAVYVPRTGMAGAYLAPNDASGEWKAVSLAQLREATGIDAFPSLPESAKVAVPDLPRPSGTRRHRDAGPVAEAHAPSGTWWLMRKLMGFVR